VIDASNENDDGQKHSDGLVSRSDSFQPAFCTFCLLEPAVGVPPSQFPHHEMRKATTFC
jgi:hypothetical protein